MISYAMRTNKGNREKNEDCAGVRVEDENGCFALADGLGGHGKGEEASAIVIETAKEMFHSGTSTEVYLEKSLSTGQEKILKYQKQSDCFNEMKTTAVLLVMNQKQLQWAHIGDSRLYYFKRNRLVSRTLDHSVPQILVETGEIKEKDIRNHPDRNHILKVMGSKWIGPQYEIARAIKRKDNQSFLLCSDGFWELIDEKTMITMLKKADSVEEWLDYMIKVVQENGRDVDMDNYTAIAVWIR